MKKSNNLSISSLQYFMAKFKNTLADPAMPISLEKKQALLRTQARRWLFSILTRWMNNLDIIS